ncbi:hypothetical protein JST99_04730 [Candidatus Dependentiae bacterium]|nr:hypothetical protein [Candidatus Dependentiae bacterium]
MNKVTIQIVMFAACLTLANPALRASEPLKFTPMSEIVEQSLRPASPHDACGDELYKLARLAREAQSNGDGSHVPIVDKQFNKCLSQYSERWVGKTRDPKALAHCFHTLSAVATKKDDSATGKFFIQHALTRELYKGGPTLSFTLWSPLYGLIGAGIGCGIGAAAGAASGAYGAGLYSQYFKTKTIENFDSNRKSTGSSIKTQGPTPLDALTGAKIGAVPGGLLGACAGFMIGGIKVSYNMR